MTSFCVAQFRNSILYFNSRIPNLKERMIVFFLSLLIFRSFGEIVSFFWYLSKLLSKKECTCYQCFEPITKVWGKSQNFFLCNCYFLLNELGPKLALQWLY